MSRIKLPSHESHGILQFNRIDGRKNLNHCPVTSNSFIRLTLRRNESEFDLGTRWDHGGETLFEVDLSNIQFAELLTNMNRGLGIPCTISSIRMDGELRGIEEPPEQESAASLTRDEFKSKVNDATESMEAARESIRESLEATNISKKKKDEILGSVDRYMRLFHDSAPFMMKCFEENAAEVVAGAKAEISAHADAVIAQTGLQAIQNGEAPKLIGLEE